MNGTARFAPLLLVFAAACGPEHVPPPAAPAPVERRVNDTIPADLDVALRLDLARIRAVLGDELFRAFESKARLSGGGDPVTERILVEAMAHADNVLVAFRPAERVELVDSVMVLRGHFAAIDPRSDHGTSPWQPPQDLGAGWRRFDRNAIGARAAPARIYARLDDTLVFVSSAELDGVERQLEQGSGDPHLEPAEQGVISLDARPAALIRYFDERAPDVARLLRSAERVKLDGDLDSVGLRMELDVTLASESGARDTAKAAGTLLERARAAPGLLSRLADGVKVEAVNNRLVAHVSLPAEVLGKLVECGRGGSCD